MKKILALLFILIALASAGEFKWARAGFGTDIGVKPEEDALGALEDDMTFLVALEAVTTLKVVKKVDIVYVTDLPAMLKYPIIFFQADHIPVFSDQEIKNIREYLNRGGFILGDDCVDSSTGDFFFQGFKDIIETRIFPEGKMVKLEKTHDIFKNVNKFPEGMPHTQGINNGAWAYFDDKGRMKIFLSSSDLHCGWHNNQPWFGEEKHLQMVQMGVNIIIYALSH